MFLPLSSHRRSGPHGTRTALLALGVAAIAACAAPRESTRDDAARDDMGEPLPAMGAAGAAATRVVSLNPVTTELLFALGAGDRLVGRTHWDLHPAAARDVPDVGNGMDPNVEAVLGRRPDLVILYASESNRAAVTQLRAAGVPTAAFRTDRVADLARITPVVAALVGRADAGRAVTDSVMRTLDAVRAARAGGEAPTAFWHVWDAPLLSVGRGSYLSELLEIAGGRNVFADLEAPSPQVSLEEVARRDPRYVIAGPEGAATIRADRRWQAVRAVREGRILVVDTGAVGRPGVRMGEAARHLQALLRAGAP